MTKMTIAADMQKVVDHIVNGTIAQSLCRICLKPLDEAAESVFTKICKEDHEYSVADIIKNICDIEVSDVDEHHACSNCFLLASAAYKFYLLTKQSDDILHFYVDELLNNVDSVVVPQNISSESLCIPLPMVNPDKEFYQLNLTDLTKKLEVKDNIALKTAKTDLDTFKSEKEQVKAISNVKEQPVDSIKHEKTVDDEDEEKIVILQEKHSSPSFFKILKDGSMVELNKSEADEYQAMFKKSVTSNGEVKKRKVREKMATLDCWLCSQKFRFTAKLKKHLKHEHSVDLLVCTICKQFFTNELEFNNHLHTHPNIFRCDICGIILKKRHTLVKHMQNHNNQTKLNMSSARMCEVCGTVLRNAKCLKIHMEKRHIKQFSCYYCGKMYKTECSFDLHIQKHEKYMAQSDKNKEVVSIKQEKKRSGEFMCAVCGRNCVDERALLWHTRLHTNERPFKCDECGRAFISLNRRNQHALTAHSAPRRRCPLCPAAFHLRSMVNTHIKKVHLRVHKRRPRPARAQPEHWRTAAVPLRDLSVALHTHVLAMQRGRAEHLPCNGTANEGTDSLHVSRDVDWTVVPAQHGEDA